MSLAVSVPFETHKGNRWTKRRKKIIIPFPSFLYSGKFKFGLFGCYLKSYAWMLVQHEAWLTIAKSATLDMG